MTMPEAETAPTPEQRSEPPKSDAAPSARAVATAELRAEQKPPRRPTLVPSVIVGLVVAAVAGLSIWYLVRPQPLLVQGEVDATRFDLAARVDGRVAEIPGSWESRWSRCSRRAALSASSKSSVANRVTRRRHLLISSRGRSPVSPMAIPRRVQIL